MHDITIRKVNQGWIATVGCQTVVFTDKERMINAFGDYVRDEKAAQEKWLDTPDRPQVAPNAGHGFREPLGLAALTPDTQCGQATTSR